MVGLGTRLLPIRYSATLQFQLSVAKGLGSVSQFVAELRKLSEHCDFVNSLEDMLRDRLVCGQGTAEAVSRYVSHP